MKYVSPLFKVFLLIGFILNAYIFLYDKTYVYKALEIGYMNGETSATIDDINYFETRIIKSSEGKQWPEGFDYNDKKIL